MDDLHWDCIVSFSCTFSRAVILIAFGKLGKKNKRNPTHSSRLNSSLRSPRHLLLDHRLLSTPLTITVWTLHGPDKNKQGSQEKGCWAGKRYWNMSERELQKPTKGMARNSTYALLMSMVSALGRKTVPIQEGSRKSRTPREERGYSTGACVLWVPPVLPIIANSWVGGRG